MALTREQKIDALLARVGTPPPLAPEEYNRRMNLIIEAVNERKGNARTPRHPDHAEAVERV